MIAVSGYIYVKDTGYKWTNPLIAYILQWIFNIAWSPLFCGKRWVMAAMVDVTLMWITIVVNIILFYDGSPLAAYLLLPYIAWVSIAWYLNFYILRNNDLKVA